MMTFFINVGQCRSLYAQGYMLVRKFYLCTIPVKVALFHAYCTPMYTAHLSYRFRENSMRKLRVAYNDFMRMLIDLPRFASASEMFANLCVPACSAVIRNLMYKFM